MKTIQLLIGLLFLVSCQQKQNTPIKTEITRTSNYELHQVVHSKSLLILFPGGGGNSTNIKQEFHILDIAKKNNISVLLMNFSGKLWIENEDYRLLENQLTAVIKNKNLNPDNIHIGGMSIGGNIALQLSNYLTLKDSDIQPKGVFIVDSPIDLHLLYKSAIKDINTAGFTEERLQEPKWIVNYFEDVFGGKDSLLMNIKNIALFTYQTNTIKNISALKNTNVRLYTEPDVKWWRENRQTDFENTNAFVIQKLAMQLTNEGWSKFELITTKNKGYRANGDRHPHSWSIVDEKDLVKWILESEL